MLSIFSRKKYFEKHEKEFLEYLHKKNGITLRKENLVLGFYDLDGNAYYKFPKELDLPIGRMGKMQEYMTWLLKGTSKEEYLQFLESADKAITDGLTNKKGGARLGFIISELTDRCNMALHDELFFNILAVQIIRHDESISEFDNDIHMQKVEMFKRMNAKDDTFFLHTQEYYEQFGLRNTTKIQLDSLLKESRAVREATTRMLKNLSE